MNISHKRMHEIEAMFKSESRVKDHALMIVAAVMTLYNRRPESEKHLHLQEFLATDPTPAPLTVADLDEADRLGYALAMAVKPGNTVKVDEMYLINRDDSAYARSSYNREAAAVATELRAIMRERGDVVVPGGALSIHEVNAILAASTATTPTITTSDAAAIIHAFLDRYAHHAEREVQS